MSGAPTTRQTAALGTALVALALAATAVVWSSLSAEMAIHWDASGTADDTAGRAVGALLLPGVALTMLVTLLAVPRLDPLEENFAQFRPAYNGFVLLLTSFFCALRGAVLAVNLDYAVPITPLVVGFAGVLFVCVGLLLRVAEPNWFVGIGTPWTLSSETVWRRVHDIGGLLFVAVGGLTVVGAAVGVVAGVPWLGTAVLVGGGIVVAVVTTGYSYYLYEKLDQPDDRPTSH